MKKVLVKSRKIERKLTHALGIALAMLAAGFATEAFAANVAPVPRGPDSAARWSGKVTDEADAPPYKEQRFLFGKPAKKNARAQMAHARALEKEGRISAARKAYNALVHQWGSAPEAAEAQFGVARLLEKAGKLQPAFREYQYFIENYSVGNVLEGATYSDVIDAQFAVANATRAKYENGGLFSTPSYELVTAMYRKIVENAPEWERAPECMMYAAACFEKEKEYDEAISAYEVLSVRYPQSGYGNDALYRAAFCRYNISKKHVRDERTMNNALVALTKAVAAAPEHESASEASGKIAEISQQLAEMNFEKARFYDEIRKNPEAAIIAYTDFIEKFPASKSTEKAKERLAQLKSEKYAAPSK